MWYKSLSLKPCFADELQCTCTITHWKNSYRKKKTDEKDQQQSPLPSLNVAMQAWLHIHVAEKQHWTASTWDASNRMPQHGMPQHGVLQNSVCLKPVCLKPECYRMPHSGMPHNGMPHKSRPPSGKPETGMPFSFKRKCLDHVISKIECLAMQYLKAKLPQRGNAPKWARRGTGGHSPGRSICQPGSQSRSCSSCR